VSEIRQLAIFTFLLVPSILAAIAAVSLLADTVSSFPRFFAGFTMSVFGLVLCIVLPCGIFLALMHVGMNRERVHLVSLVVFGLVIALSAAWSVASWSHGEKYQGYGTTWVLAAFNAATAVLLFVPLVANWRRPGFSPGHSSISASTYDAALRE